ncbi:UDP-glycosyltransferase 83A1, partial [Mucuna pruriens]
MVEQQHSLDDESLLRLVSIPDGLGPDDDRNEPGKLLDAVYSTMPTTLEKLIEDTHLNGDNRISFIVADLAMLWALEVGSKLGIKGAVFCPIAATMFALLCNLDKLLEDGIINSQGLLLTTEKTIPLSPNMPEMDPRNIFWLNMPGTKNGLNLMHITQTLNLTEWWLCNTTYELEPEVLNFVPKILPIGPLLRNYDHDNTNATARSLGQFWKEDLSCMSWLDQQPNCSVTYVAFGSITLFDQNQFNELALALDLTNRPFLWVVRPNNKMRYPYQFQGCKGKIIEWAPQQKVLNHPSIACFVSHCGWNSILEDQIYDKTYICDVLNVGVGLNSDENGLVSRWEIQKQLNQLHNDQNIRSRSSKLKEKLINNKVRSSDNFDKFVKWLKE